MQQDRWTVMEYPSGSTDDASEVSWHYTFDKAVRIAEKHHSKTGLAYRIDLNVVEVHGRGVETIDSEPDQWGVEEVAR